MKFMITSRRFGQFSHQFSRRSGQAIIETGLVITALTMLSLGMLQYGLAYNATLTLNNMAREGARFAAVRATRSDVKIELVKYLGKRAAGTTISPETLTDKTVALAFELPNSAQATRRAARVTITYNMTQNKGFLPTFVPFPASWNNYKATAANVIEGATPSATPTPGP